MTTTAQTERERIEDLEESTVELRDVLLGILEDTKGLAEDQEYSARFNETQKRLFELHHGLNKDDLRLEDVSDIRNLLMNAMEEIQNIPEERSLDVLDKLIVSAEAMRHILRDALDRPELDIDKRSLILGLLEWLPGISHKDLAELLGISDRTLSRWLKYTGDPNRRLKLVVRLVNNLRHAWTPEGVVAWFHRLRQDLDGLAPIDVLDDAEYEHALIAATRRGRAGHGS